MPCPLCSGGMRYAIQMEAGRSAGGIRIKVPTVYVNCHICHVSITNCGLGQLLDWIGNADHPVSIPTDARRYSPRECNEIISSIRAARGIRDGLIWECAFPEGYTIWKRSKKPGPKSTERKG